MSKIFTRSVLHKAFDGDPRAIAEFEKFDTVLSGVDANGRSLTDKIDRVLDLLGDGDAFQKAHTILDALTKLEPGKIGVIETTQDGTASIREIDALDPASLLSRGVAYTILMGFAGKGTTAQRPVTPANAGAVYLDTDLDVDGQPIIWNGSYWVDFQGVPV